MLRLASALLPHIGRDDQAAVNTALFLLAEGTRSAGVSGLRVAADAWAAVLESAHMHAAVAGVERSLAFQYPGGRSEQGRCGRGKPLCYVNSRDTALVDVYFGNNTLHVRENVRVALLPHSTFLRRCPRGFDGKAQAANPAGAVVAHCYTPKTSEGKQSGFSSFNLWYLE